MTIARTALRLAAAQIIKGTAAAGRPTIAEGRVYDSRISDIEPETFSEDAKPIVIILTDGEEGEQLSKQNGGPPFRRMIDLVLELAIVQRLQAEDDPNTFIIGYPDTDARHEASLDFLEFQIMRELSYGLSPMAVVFRRIARIVKEDSHRQVTDDSGVKVACRILTLCCDTVDDDVRMTVATDPPTAVVLPSPLSLVAAVMPPNTSGADVIAAITAALTPIEVVPLKGIDVEIDANAGANVPDDKVQATIELSE